MPRLLALFAIMPTLATAAPFEFKANDRIVMVGNTVIERAQHYSHIQLQLNLLHPDKDLTFRNLGWSGDNVYGESRSYFGSRDQGFKHLVQYVEMTKPTVLIIGYGNNAAFAGPDGLDEFIKQYNILLDNVEKQTKRIILLSPTPQERHPAPLPDPSAFNKNAAIYAQAIQSLAAKRGYFYADVFNPLIGEMDHATTLLTDNSKHFTDEGYAVFARVLASILSGKKAPTIKTTADITELRQLIQKKDELFFHRYRPQNETYLRGFRKHEQGQNAKEIPQFDPLVEAEEKKIHTLSKRIKS